jgi:GrpB-like predicted nucleotidyltransferase (UPF0157 family)
VEPEEPVVIVASDPQWAEEFLAIATPIRRALGDFARRIDHVGSTAVPGSDAKPVIDIQISVPALEPGERFRAPLERLGFVFQPENRDRSKRFFREPAGARRTHVHVRPAGSFDEQLNLLFRDYLRTHPDAVRSYGEAKRRLAVEYRTDREGYVQAKEPTVWELLRKAHDWAQSVGWSPGPSDV